MKVLIENYRKWDIYFETMTEEFFAEKAHEYDKIGNKKTLTAARKVVDEWIKENEKFQPVKVQRLPIYRGDSETTITLIGLRKDGAFVYENEQGEKKQLSTYDENNFFLVDFRNDKILSEMKEIARKIDLLNDEYKSKSEKLIRISVTDLRKEIINK